jgi:hypothetical protein
MSSQLITEKQTDQPRPGAGGADLPPSLVREDDPGVARIFGFLGAVLIIFAGTVLFLARIGRPNPFVGTGLAVLLLAVGLGGLLFHAALDRDLQVRRIYLIFAALGLLLALILCIAAFVPSMPGELFFSGLLCAGLALAFILCFLRNETDLDWRFATQAAVGVAGALAAVVGLLGGFLSPDRFLLPWGLVLGAVGLVYGAVFVGSRGSADPLGYRAGIALGAFGLFVLLAALTRSIFPRWFASTGLLANRFFMPYGLLLSASGLLYLIASVFLINDSRLVVMIRRELGAFFFSPIAYIVLFAFVVFHGLAFALFVSQLLRAETYPEPIVSLYLGQWWQIIFLIFLVPILTMRLLSEEKRTGTLEVLFTAPVNEVHVVLSKFIAALLLFLLMWAPFFLYLIALRLGNEGPENRRGFDYIPLLGFALSLLVSGSAFVSIGLFFSSLFRDQITSGVFTFILMLGLTLVFLIRQMLPAPESPDAPNAWAVVLRQLSYIDLWFESLRGRILLRDVYFQLATAVFFLFLTTKVLEARKWL